jgi:hypothetical protein
MIRAMVRTFTLVVLLSSLLAGWWLMATTYRHLGPRADREPAPGPLALEKAARALEEWRGDARTYAGARLSGFPDVALVRADASSYCLELTRSGGAYHREGPNGAATAGRCPNR